MMRHLKHYRPAPWRAAAAALLALIYVPVGIAQPIRLGILGDSNSDEYRANDNRGGTYASVTFSWIEVLTRLRDVDPGPWGTRGEPRRTGYGFNWARSGARASDLGAQQVGLAEQVRQGRVEYVIIHIGTNDFQPNGDYKAIYDGTLTGSALQQKVNSVLSSIRSAVNAIAGAGAKVIVTGVPDPGLHPMFHTIFPDAAKRQRVTNAINTINSALASDAASNPNVGFADMASLFEELARRTNTQGALVVGGVEIDAATPGNEPHHLQLADNAGHLGTVGSSLMANQLFISPLNREFKTNIPLLGDQEILCVAGIAAKSCTRPNPPTGLSAN